jgi:signal transduction histidine kinase
LTRFTACRKRVCLRRFDRSKLKTAAVTRLDHLARERALRLLLCIVLSGCRSRQGVPPPSIEFTKIPLAGAGGPDQAAQAITEGRDAVQGLRSSTVVTNDLVSAISTLGQELVSGETNPDAAEFRVEVEGTPRNLHPILRDEVYRIAGEALRNAFKHAQAQRIEVEIRYDERHLRLRVRDDGKGTDAKHLNEDGQPGHYGLRGMRERAKLLGGKLAVWSERDSGTEVELRIPASRAYETSPVRRRWWLAEKFSVKDTEVKS